MRARPAARRVGERAACLYKFITTTGEGVAPLWPTTVHELEQGKEGRHQPSGGLSTAGVIETIINSGWLG